MRCWSEEGEESAGVIGDMQMLMVHPTPHDAPPLRELPARWGPTFFLLSKKTLDFCGPKKEGMIGL